MITAEEKQYFTRIINLFKEKDYETALSVANEAVVRYPNNPLFLAKQVTSLFRTGRVKEARLLADSNFSLLRKDTYFLNTYLGILASLKQKKDIEQIIDREILGSSHPLHESVYLYAEQLSRRLFSSQKANAVREKAQSLFPHSTKISSLGKTPEKNLQYYATKFGDVPRTDAIQEIESIRGLPDFSRDVGLHLYLGKLYEADLNYDTAIGIYQYILSFAEDYHARTQLGFAYYHKGDLESALINLGPAFIKAPRSDSLRATVVKICEKKKDYVALERLCRTAMANNTGANFLYGILKKAEKWKKD